MSISLSSSVKTALIAVLVSAAVSAGAMFIQPSASKTDKVVVLNTIRLISSSTKQIVDSGLPKDKALEVSSALSNNLTAIIRRYRDEGYIVLNSNGATAWPEENDITAAVAEELGVTLGI